MNRPSQVCRLASSSRWSALKVVASGTPLSIRRKRANRARACIPSPAFMAWAGPHNPPDGVPLIALRVAPLHVVVDQAEVMDQLHSRRSRKRDFQVSAGRSAREETEHPVKAFLGRRGVIQGFPVAPTHVIGHHPVERHLAGGHDAAQLGVHPDAQLAGGERSQGQPYPIFPGELFDVLLRHSTPPQDTRLPSRQVYHRRGDFYRGISAVYYHVHLVPEGLTHRHGGRRARGRRYGLRWCR